MTALVKPLTLLLGIVLTAVGVLGFFMDPIVIFEVNAAHNVVHLASGVIALLTSSSLRMSRLYLMVFGLVYALVTVLGFLNVAAVTELLDINMADNYLHLGIAAVSMIVGFGSKNA